jgi:hypothetical protein
VLFPAAGRALIAPVRAGSSGTQELSDPRKTYPS